MKREISPVLVAVVLGIVLLGVLGFYWRSMGQREESRPPVMTGPVKLPASQVGTRLGNQTLGTTFPSTTSSPSTGK
jgi:hypothetical protein